MIRRLRRQQFDDSKGRRKAIFESEIKLLAKNRFVDESPVLQKMSSPQPIEWPCPVYGFDSFGVPPGSYGICPVCGWEDDPIQIRHPRMRGGANGGSIFDYQQQFEKWNICETGIRDPSWRLLHPTEAPLDNGEVGLCDYSLDYYGSKEPYYWRLDATAEQGAALSRRLLSQLPSTSEVKRSDS